MLLALGSLIVIAISVYLLAIITDEYFIISLDALAHRLRLPANVAGASLMAIGSSAPELAIALLALFTAGGIHSDIGIGTIVGSAIFNILVITGASAIVRPAHISMRVVLRDILMYVLSVTLLLFTMFDGVITLFEALLYLIGYGFYLVILLKWDSFVTTEEVPQIVEETIHQQRQSENLYFRVTERVSGWIGLLMGDAHTRYIRAFSVSIGLIALISWVLINSAVIFSEAVNIPPVIVALTILAAGTSIPDLFASVIVARQGRGDMAIANAVGSNIFDILVGLGLPWLLAMLLLGQTIEFGADGLFSSAVMLMGTVLVLFVFLTTGRKLVRKEGWVLLAGYGAYVLWSMFSGA